MTSNSQDKLPSKTNVIKKSSSTSPSTSVKKNNWISANPFINYIRNCRKNDFFESDGSNFLQYAGEQWRLMSSKEKQPYVNGAALIKKQRLMKIETATRGQKRKRLSGILTMKKSVPPKKGKKDRNKDKKDKSKKRRKSSGKKRGNRRKKMKRQRLMKNDTESDSGTDNSPETSDNESVASDEIM
ncbi:hypothetical protein PV325_001799 [Microctonus aethiopoides]|nr:hypothetical protein PV325_001799 [Microctonus aethiopoides]